MKTTIREQRLRWPWLELGLVVGLAGAASLVMPEAVLGGRLTPSSTVRVRVNNYTQASSPVLAAAEREASRIFGDAGIAVVWLNCLNHRSKPVEPDPCHEAHKPTDIFLRVLSAPARNEFQGTVFGFAVRPLLASVYYDRVLLRAMSDGDQFEVHFILGAVIAHEIGHLLIGSNGHSSWGIMQASWDLKHIRHAEMGTLRFTPEQARLIQTEMQARLKQRAAIATEAGIEQGN